MAGHENSGNNTQLLEELEALSSSLYQSHTAAATRRTASLALPRNTTIPTLNNDSSSSSSATADKARSGSRPRRRLSLSPWRSRPNNDQEEEQEEKPDNDRTRSERSRHVRTDSSSTDNRPEGGGGGGAWKNWKPIRALSHIGMQKLSCLFSVEVVTVQNLPASMNGLRLSVCVRKKETRDGAVQTMPSRVSQGAADFEETLFLRCHVYCSEQASDRGRRGGKTLKFEPRPFWVYAFAVDAGELDFGRSSVDLSQLIQESIEKNHEGARVRTWDVTFGLAGKAKGGDLVVKLGFQIMEKDGGIGIYNYNTVSSPNSSSPSSSSNTNTNNNNTKSSKGFLSPSFARKQSKSSFSVPSPKLSSKKEPAWTPLQSGISSGDEIDDLNLDEPEKKPETQSKPPEVVPAAAVEPELDLPDFDVVDKGVEFQEIDNNNNVENEKKKDEEEEEEEEEEENDKSSVKSVVKEIDHVHVERLSELDSIAQQIKALESIMGDENENNDDGKKISRETKHKSQRLEADEETVTREFLQLLEDEEDMIDNYKLDDDIDMNNITPAMNNLGGGGATELDNDKTYISDLGKNLGCVVRTRDGGYLAAMNPLETETTRKETPKLAMQISKPFLVAAAADRSGFELFQAMASVGAEELSSTLGRVLIEPMDELMGKTAEQIAFEGIAGAVISGRNRSVAASSSAGGAIAAARAAAAAMGAGRRERAATGIWNVSEEPVGPEEAVAFSMQRIEAMAVEGIKIQADMADEEAPFDVPPSGKKSDHPLSKVVPLEEWVSKDNIGNVKSLVLGVGIQLRDPVRRYEAVGGPMVGIIYADGVEGCDGGDDDEKRFKVTSVHLGGVRVNGKKVKSTNNSNKQRLTAMQWLVGYGFGSSNNKIKVTKNLQSSSQSVKGQDVLWSLSSRVMADMWLKSMRNPDVKFTN